MAIAATLSKSASGRRRRCAPRKCEHTVYVSQLSRRSLAPNPDPHCPSQRLCSHSRIVKRSEGHGSVDAGDQPPKPGSSTLKYLFLELILR
jgi:hypothetical protein